MMLRIFGFLSKRQRPSCRNPLRHWSMLFRLNTSSEYFHTKSIKSLSLYCVANRQAKKWFDEVKMKTMKLRTGTFCLQSAQSFVESVIACSLKTERNHLNPAFAITIVRRCLRAVCFISSAFSSCRSAISRLSLPPSPFSIT